MKKWWILIFGLLILFSVGFGSAENYTTLQEYFDSIDYYCESDADCVVKDIHKCCGADLVCVSNDAVVDSDFVVQACEDEGVVSTCDYSEDKSCICSNNVCTGFTQEFPESCPKDAKICEDGTVLERQSSLGCEFPACPEEEIICEDLCGDGECQEIVCLGEGCPCAEVFETCPADCIGQLPDDGETSDGGVSLIWLFVGIFLAVVLVFIGIKIAKWLIWSAIIAGVIFILVYVFLL